MINPFTLNPFIALVIILAAVFFLREYFTFKDNLPLKYLLTPSITAMFIGIVIMAFYHNEINIYGVLVLTALILSLIADVMLMIVEIDLLKYGIIYFLSAHVVYIFAFSREYVFQPWNIAVGLFLMTCVLVFFYRIGRHAGKLMVPVIVYSVVLASMIYFALARLGNESTGAYLVAPGAILFAISDTCLALNAFKSRIPHSSVVTWSTYAPAQFLFAVSCFFQ